MPRDLKDLGPFRVTSFPGDGKNLKIVSGIPPKASITPNQRISPARASAEVDDDRNIRTDSKSRSLPPLTSWSSSTTSLQLFYPKGSINPAQKPKGGEEFYASPLGLSSARNVSLRYSVYFPSDFDWVLAGKLPGLYGGHTGCSGGNAALDCFSTRLMWRTGGAGELYLYAGKDKQPTALCSDPRSECNAVYGFSIGRGSFTWAAGAWTTVVQTVVLNTPGKQDGAFSLDVNGRRVVEKHGVFYRDALWPSSGTGRSKTSTSAKTGTNSTGPATTSAPMVKPTTTKVYDPLGDILGPLLSEITHLIRRSEPTATSDLPILKTGSAVADTSVITVGPRAEVLRPTRGHHTSHTPPSIPHNQDDSRKTPPACDEGGSEGCGNQDTNSGTEDENNMPVGIQGAAPQREGNSIGFVGLFFSTFFGGHDEKYATPKDQYVWFKDFALSYND
ncbi:hypothetical protein FA13DRAFT_1791698 [Coprinellus micaceus]|uniref:Polysaccharide lyase 14 domain-containing protein n=1 Tax=Coprinellus micaceus TaxID=71717 RepID=A0A4Y7TD43_COPMI|nr:hypothetical protein FA13DRAFT_1791698 [Coprinellus micaceus]